MFSVKIGRIQHVVAYKHYKHNSHIFSIVTFSDDEFGDIDVSNSESVFRLYQNSVNTQASNTTVNKSKKESELKEFLIQIDPENYEYIFNRCKGNKLKNKISNFYN